MSLTTLAIPSHRSVEESSALSVEITDKLNEVLKQATLADKLRGEVEELTNLLKDNLGKVAQHGKRIC